MNAQATDRDLTALRAAIDAGQVTHSRVKTWCRVTEIYVYQRDPASPTGCRLFDCFPETPEILALLQGALSPLSPIEPR